MSEHAEICVVGGGIVGLAVALALCERGRTVIVLERDRIGQGAAAAVAAGMLSPASEADLSDPRVTRLALESHAAYPAWVASLERSSGIAVGYDRTGTLFVALHHDHLALLERLRAFQVERGLAAAPLGARELRALEPFLAPTLVGGLRLRDDHQVDPRRLLAALAGALRRTGAPVIEGAEVSAVDAADEALAVVYARAGRPGRIACEQVVLAAGAWSGRIVIGDAPLGLPLRPVKGQILRLRGAPLLRHVVRTPDVYLVPRADGELVVGATMEEQGFDGSVTAGAVHDLLREARRVVPGIAEFDLAECGVGFRPALRDHLPAIGELDVPGVFVATGHFRNGVELTPITARLVADLLCDGRRDALLDLVDPRRFAPAEACA